jgi:hypothetical protein
MDRLYAIGQTVRVQNCNPEMDGKTGKVVLLISGPTQPKSDYDYIVEFPSGSRFCFWEFELQSV